ncbi:MAG: hypothetical protein U0946_02595 [Patescibacteria group bacterium]|nr:hypothetical protein [Patescibacteria group bacterium]
MGQEAIGHLVDAISLCFEARKSNLSSSCGGVILRALGANVDLTFLTGHEYQGMNLTQWTQRHNLRILGSSSVQINFQLSPEVLRNYLIYPKLEGTLGKVLGIIGALKLNDNPYDRHNHGFLILPRDGFARVDRKRMKDGFKLFLYPVTKLRNG